MLGPDDEDALIFRIKFGISVHACCRTRRTGYENDRLYTAYPYATYTGLRMHVTLQKQIVDCLEEVGMVGMTLNVRIILS